MARRPPPPPPPPEGTGKKRTPGGQKAHTFDPAASKDVYEPEKIIGQRLSKGVTYDDRMREHRHRSPRVSDRVAFKHQG